jgi:integrase
MTLQTTTKSKAISQYIESVTINSEKTSYQYERRLRNFETYFSKTYNFTIDDYLINKTFTVDVYALLSGYVFYLTTNYVSPDGFKLANITIKNGINTVRYFLEYYDIEINPRKYKLRVRQPKVIRQFKEALTKDDITRILHMCESYKLKTFVHTLAVTGCRASEACAIRLMDIDFKNSKVNIRGEYTKTKEDRYVFLTEELIKQLQDYLDYKYRRRVKYSRTGELPRVIIPERKDTDLVFASYFYDSKEENLGITYIYNTLLIRFDKTLNLLNVSYENNSTKRRHKITFHSFRRFVKSTISDLGYSDYSEWYIGHAGSTYYRRSEKDKLELFRKIEPYLTFFNTQSLAIRQADMLSQIKALEQENMKMEKDRNNLEERFAKLEAKAYAFVRDNKGKASGKNGGKTRGKASGKRNIN